MFVFILFPSMGVWAMRSRLRYFVQPVYQIEADKLGHSTAYKYAQELREKLQSKINQLLNSN
jgi:hypothetical protein